MRDMRTVVWVLGGMANSDFLRSESCFYLFYFLSFSCFIVLHFLRLPLSLSSFPFLLFQLPVFSTVLLLYIYSCIPVLYLAKGRYVEDALESYALFPTQRFLRATTSLKPRGIRYDSVVLALLRGL